jgi:AAA family ATP:ADP antiporter
MLLGSLLYFFLFSSYFILRPIRDAMGVAAGVSKLPWLFAATLAAMLVCNPLFSALVVRFPVKWFITITYVFFAANMIAFYVLGRLATGALEVWLGRVFFVWISVFNLFVNSLFWAFMADTFRNEQGKRLFGFIGVGGTVGAVVGSGVTATLAQRIGTTNLFLVATALLLVATLIAVTFPKGQGQPRAEAEEKREKAPIGGSTWAGISHVLRSRYLTGISILMLLFTFGSTVLYFEQAEVIGKYFPTRNARTEVLAKMELTAQLAAAVVQLFLTGRIIRWIGLPATLAFMPALSVLGFSAVGASASGVPPLKETFIGFSVARRAANFALGNPSKAVLYTVVSREDKYKAQNFIETFVYRAGDQIAAWGYAGLTALGLGLTGIAWVAVPLSLVLLVLGVWLGRKEEKLAGELDVERKTTANALIRA